MEKEFCINGWPCKVAFIEEVSVRSGALANGMAAFRSLGWPEMEEWVPSEKEEWRMRRRSRASWIRFVLKVDSVCGHDSLSFSKKEKVDSYVEVAISKETKSADEKARSNVGVRVIKCNKSGSERAGAPFQVLDVQEVNDRGPSSLKECSL
ncbi:hypothetical protein ACSQ67_023839 [Phaseolus vulgaris]